MLSDDTFLSDLWASTSSVGSEPPPFASTIIDGPPVVIPRITINPDIVTALMTSPLAPFQFPVSRPLWLPLPSGGVSPGATTTTPTPSPSGMATLMPLVLVAILAFFLLKD